MQIIRLTTVLFILFILCNGCVKHRADDVHPAPQLPEIDFSWTGDLSAPALVKFINKSRYADRYQWSFGNRQMSTKEHPEDILFDSAGFYKVVLRGEQGSHAVWTTKIIEIVTGQAPVARFSYSFANGNSIAPATLLLENESLHADEFLWQVNGMYYNAKNPSPITLRQPGEYLVRLTAIKGEKTSPTYAQTVLVTANADPVARFIISNNTKHSICECFFHGAEVKYYCIFWPS